MNRNGALAGILVGGVTIVLWKQLSGGWFDVYEQRTGNHLLYTGYLCSK
ncbi:hypothetical protein P4S64_12640 [Vibrio sp. M60_M31a]